MILFMKAMNAMIKRDIKSIWVEKHVSEGVKISF